MKTYIGTKIIKAKAMNAEDANAIIGRNPSLENAEGDSLNGYPGYLVEYPDGYQSWSPKRQFEEVYKEMIV